VALLIVSTFILSLVAACGDSSSESLTTTETTTSITTQTTATQTATAIPTVPPSYDVMVSGRLQTEWKSGTNDGSAAACIFQSPAGALFTVYGSIAGKGYVLRIRQHAFQAGAFEYLGGGGTPHDTLPFVTLTTPTDESINWTASGVGQGTGTATITGGGSDPVVIALDLNLEMSGTRAVHLAGTVNCPVS
jgi:hypothetical protein